VNRHQYLIIITIFALFIGLSIVPSSGIIIVNKPSTINNNGEVLYVGGVEPGNYSTIQDAIDSANPGDTIFVYKDSSPYYENVKINKMIKLIGESRNTTIINGRNKGNTISIFYNANNVVISGFTITEGGDGIFVYSDNNTIQGNKIVFNYHGIEIDYDADYNIITNNIILHNRAAGIFDGGRDSGSTITWNVIGSNGKEFPWWSGLYKHYSGGYYHHNDFHFNGGTNAFTEHSYWGIWDDDSEGNYWDDWEYNPGYPNKYVIEGTVEDQIDKFPNIVPFVNYPIVSIYSSYYAEVNKLIYFLPTLNVDPSSVSWFWEFGDGEISYEIEPSYSYSKPGKYKINVTITDNQGNSDTDKSIAYIGVPPDTPSITGPPKCKRGRSYNYTIVANDSDGGNLYYYIDWDLGYQIWIGPYPAGEEVTISHCWNYSYVYTISVKAIDEADFESDWAYLTVHVPRNRVSYNSVFLRFFDVFLLLEKFLSIF